VIQSLRSAFTGTAVPQENFAYFSYEQPLCIAHRGGMACWPENTVFAFSQADALGVDALEMDVHRTRDGELVVSHDPAIERCTNGKGAIEHLTLAEVQSADAGYWFTPDEGETFPFRGKGIRIPTMREVFERFGHLRYIIDAKPPRPEVALQLAALARECGVTEKVCLASFHRGAGVLGGAVSRARRLLPEYGASPAGAARAVWRAVSQRTLHSSGA
jgi:glycerophosphoryl diester phosphodiesterase